jgi:branched-chain amino acid transport system permease protein
MMDILNALVALLNFVIVPAMSYGSQLALGALGVTLIYGILRFSNFAHGDTMAFGAMVTILMTWFLQARASPSGPCRPRSSRCPWGSRRRPSSFLAPTGRSIASTGGRRRRP